MTIDKDLTSNSKLLKTLSHSALANLEALLERKDYPEGSIVFRENDPGDQMYFIETGLVAITKTIEGDIQTPLAAFGPGQCFGEMSLIEHSARSATAKTQEATVLLCLSRDSFEAYLNKDPLGAAQFLMGVLWEVNERLRHTDELLRDTIYWGMRAGGHLTISEKHTFKEKS
ncbi:MAG: cyclic nucleotide-binding domain-containing protein [Candidatus Melainabacteria bacterium]|nr:cyclic nucleotide-binding domain-containing protein [Candidatus Melainabacteria bacterium]